MWYCKKCGAENLDGHFCSICGAESEEFTVGANSYSFEEPTRAKKGGKGPLIAIIAVAAVLIIGLLVGVFALVGRDKSPEATEGTGVIYYVSSEDGYTALYDDHNIESAVLANLANGSPVEFVSEENSVFYYVTDLSTNLSGYVRSEDLVSSLDDVIGTDTEEDIEAISLGDYYVTGADDKIALRDAPDGNTVVYVFNGYHVALIEKTSTSWWYVFDYISGEYGYIKKGYLTDDPDKVVSGTAVEVKPSAPADKTIIADYVVDGVKNYLAIRSAPSSSADVEIGKSYNGNTVGLIEKTNSTFWYVYDYNSGIYGYVKCQYLDYMYDVYSNTSSLGSDEYIVTDTKNYLALRSEPKDSADVEIGKTYNGNVVRVEDYYSNTYWYVYDYNSGLYGYVKCKYLSK